MFLTAMHFTTALLVALVMGTTLAHALEMPAKMPVSASFWVDCQHTLYRFFRYVAGPIEVAAVLISAALAYFTFSRAAFGASAAAGRTRDRLPPARSAVEGEFHVTNFGKWMACLVWG
jgi:hypothetical protein